MILEFDDGNKIEYEVIKKNVKNINIRISDGKIFVSSPKRVSDKEIIALLKEKENWILKAIESTQSRKNIKDSDELLFNGQDQYYFFGRKYNVLVQRRIYNDIQCKNSTIFVYTYFEDVNDIKKYFKVWEKEKLKVEIKKCLAKHSELLNYLAIRELNIKIKSMKSCWGICTPRKRNISINSKLIHYDLGCLEYIVVHELSHIRHANHSKSFYELVELHMPNYKAYSDKLNKFLVE